MSVFVSVYDIVVAISLYFYAIFLFFHRIYSRFSIPTSFFLKTFSTFRHSERNDGVLYKHTNTTFAFTLWLFYTLNVLISIEFDSFFSSRISIHLPTTRYTKLNWFPFCYYIFFSHSISISVLRLNDFNLKHWNMCEKKVAFY